MRSKANWSLLGEKPTSYLLGLEKRMAKNKTITALTDNEGKLVTSNKEILALEKQFFENIYSEDPESLSSLEDFPLSSADTSTILDQQKRLLNVPFTHREILAALKDLGSNKSPGLDGLTKEFYVTFWDLLRIPYLASIEYGLSFRRTKDWYYYSYSKKRV